MIWGLVIMIMHVHCLLSKMLTTQNVRHISRY